MWGKRIFYFIAHLLLVSCLEILPRCTLHDPMLSDLVILADMVSQPEAPVGTYHVLQTCDSPLYDTRMRVYASEDTTVIVFRPTQQTPQGGDIHVDRHVSPADFLQHKTNQGRVHYRFQQAYLEMVHSCRSVLSTLATGKQNLYVTGHSLGGSFSLFMAASLYYDFYIVPQGVYAFAGTFIGDEEYTEVIQRPLVSTFPVQLMEVVDRHDPNRRDGTSEQYQTSDQSLDIVTSMICGLYIDPLGPQESYGLHDLKNYQKAILENTSTYGSNRCWKDAPSWKDAPLMLEARWC
jgi:hypothetical protein